MEKQPQVIAMPPTVTDVSDRIARFAATFSADDIPSSARHMMQLSLVDWTAVAIAGTNEPVARIVREMIDEEAGVPQAFVIGSPNRRPARAAALANGATSHALDYDDTHFMYLGHPSVAVVPAALAIADKVGASPQAFADATLVGVEIACRIGGWLGREHYEKGFHATATAGCIGAAMAAARLLQLNVEQTRNALGLVSSRASGVRAQFGTMGKPYHAGMAASNGVEAALLAQRGFVPSVHGLDGAQGLAATHYGSYEASALEGLGTDFVFEQVQHKFHACCHGTHAALEAVKILRRNHNLMPQDIEHVTIGVIPRYLNVCDIAEPQTGLEIKFSFRMVTAMALYGFDTASLETFSDVHCDNPSLVALRNRVSVETPPGISDTAAIVSITRHGADPVSAEFDLSEPIPAADREAKVLEKAVSLLGGQRADSLWRFLEAGQALPSAWIGANRDDLAKI